MLSVVVVLDGLAARTYNVLEAMPHVARREMPHVEGLVRGVGQTVVDSPHIVEAVQLVEGADARELSVVEVRVFDPAAALCSRLELDNTISCAGKTHSV